jgi:hypothetical protein
VDRGVRAEARATPEDIVIALAIVCLLVAAAIVALMLIVGFTGTLTFATFAGDVVTRPFWVFLLGAATMLVALLGLSLLRRGTRRKVERRREIKRLRRVEQEAQPSTVPGPSARGGGGAPRSQPPDDTPDRTLVREQRQDVDLRTESGSLRTPPGEGGPQH